MLYDFGEERGIDGMTVTKDGVIVATAGSKENAGVCFFAPSGKKLGVPADARRPEQLLLRRRGQEDALRDGGEEFVSREADGGRSLRSASDRMTRLHRGGVRFSLAA